MVRRSCLEKIGVFDESLTYCEDWDLWMRIAQVYPVGHVPEFLTCFRVFHKYRPEVFAHHNLQEKHLYVIRKVLESEETIPLEIRNNALARIIWWGALVDFGIKDAAAARKRIQKHYAEGLLCGMNSRELANEVVGFAAGLFDDHTPVADAVEFIDFVFMNIPVELAHLQQHRRWALGTLFRRYAFQARYEGDGEYARSLMWRSVSMWPPYIFDIGVITTCLTGTWRDKYRSKTSTGNQGN
jgi:cellulose synthase/poly-beta-1,6-N-acetylglucosamine synthase-like glycosyltransferase